MSIELILIIIALTLLLIALAVASSAGPMFLDTFNKFNKITNSRGMFAEDYLVYALQRLRLDDVRIGRIHGKLTDAYSYKNKAIYISDECFQNDSISAISVVSHELGHAIQHHENANLFVAINVLRILNKLLSWSVLPLIIIGILMAFVFSAYVSIGIILLSIGISVFIITLLYRLITINIEYDASKKAIEFMKNEGILRNKEVRYAKKVMKSAALTYVAQFFAEMLYWTMLIRKPKRK